jgi:hypothetical protein
MKSLWSRVVAVAVLAAAPILTASAASKEVLTDRCSDEVSIVAFYDALPGSSKAFLVKRPPGGETAWTPAITVRLSKAGYFRWWCHSTTGNAFDPGTWRIEDISAGIKCHIFTDGTPEKCEPDGNIKIGSSAWNGWTPEESRCKDRSTKIRVQLGRNRLLQIECLGH